MNISIIHIIYIHVPAIMKSSLSNLITVFFGGRGYSQMLCSIKIFKIYFKTLD